MSQMMNTAFPNLIKPMTIRGFRFKNRMLMAPLSAGEHDPNNRIGNANIKMYERYALGGSPRVITNDNPVNNVDAGYMGGRLAFYSEGRELMALSQDIRKFVTAVHRHDSLAFSEIEHEGISASNGPDTRPIGPSEMSGPASPMDLAMGMTSKATVRPMTQEDIDRIIGDFAKCCENGKRMGLDGMLIHGGHGKIIDQFRSGVFNRRTDKYGGSVKNRCRFGIELLRECRRRVGNDFLLELRLSGVDGMPGGITAEDTIEFLKLLDGEDVIDMIHLSAGVHFTPQYNMMMSAPSFFPNFYNLPVAERIKDAGIKTPLGLLNGVNDPYKAEEVLAKGKADFVLMARQITIADPYFPQKVMDGKPEQIDRCIRCFCCYDGKECAVNSLDTTQYGGELLYPVPKAVEKRRVLIIGGGIAGMRAADLAAKRGHDVVLCEKAGYLGGILRFSDTDAYKFDIREYKNNMIKRIESEPNVEIRLNTEVTPEYIVKEAPYAVVVAVGARKVIPAIPGSDGPNVIDMMDVYDRPERVGHRVVMLGGGLSGCEVGMHLGKMGHKVTIVCRRERLLYHEAFMPFFDPIPSFMEAYASYDEPAEVLLETDAYEIFDGGVKCRGRDGKEFILGCDTVVLTQTLKENIDYAYSFNATAPYVRIAGDCKAPKKIKQTGPAAYYAVMDIT